MAEFASNSWNHAGTRKSPFYLLYGYDPEFTIQAGPGKLVPAADERLDALAAARKEAVAALEVANEQMKRHYDRYIRDAPEFQPGELVWIEATHLPGRGTPKLADRRIGPYPIIRRIGEVDYEVDLQDTVQRHNIFHVSLLFPDAIDEIEGRTHPPPPPVTIENAKEYVVESVTDARWWRRKLQYLVHWKGYTPIHDSWEPLSNLQNAQEAIADFYEANPEAPRPDEATEPVPTPQKQPSPPQNAPPARRSSRIQSRRAAQTTQGQ